jgi:hypothetical protein
MINANSAFYTRLFCFHNSSGFSCLQNSKLFNYLLQLPVFFLALNLSLLYSSGLIEALTILQNVSIGDKIDDNYLRRYTKT